MTPSLSEPVTTEWHLSARKQPPGDTMEEPVELPAPARRYMEACARGLAESPPTPDALFVRAVILAVLGRRAEAIVTLDALAKLAPAYPGLWRFKARLYRDMGDRKMADLCLAADGRDGA